MKSYRGKKSSRKNKGRKSNKINTRFLQGGSSSVAFPSSFSNADVAVSPQSYLPYNNFANDPNYSVISSSNTGPFLTGVSSGGAKKKGRKTRRLAKTMKRRGRGRGRGTRVFRGGSEASSVLSNAMNTVVVGKGIMPVPHVNEISGASGVMSMFSNTGSLYNSTNPSPMVSAPLA